MQLLTIIHAFVVVIVLLSSHILPFRILAEGRLNLSNPQEYQLFLINQKGEILTDSFPDESGNYRMSLYIFGFSSESYTVQLRGSGSIYEEIQLPHSQEEDISFISAFTRRGREYVLPLFTSASVKLSGQIAFSDPSDFTVSLLNKDRKKLTSVSPDENGHYFMDLVLPFAYRDDILLSFQRRDELLVKRVGGELLGNNDNTLNIPAIHPIKIFFHDETDFINTDNAEIHINSTEGTAVVASPIQADGLYKVETEFLTAPFGLYELEYLKNGVAVADALISLDKGREGSVAMSPLGSDSYIIYELGRMQERLPEESS